MLSGQSKWGDEFAELVPRWAPKPKGCTCKDVQRKMNGLAADTADQLFDQFADAIFENARKSKVLAMLPASKLRSAIIRRLDLSFRRAFGRSRRA